MQQDLHVFSNRSWQPMSIVTDQRGCMPARVAVVISWLDTTSYETQEMDPYVLCHFLCLGSSTANIQPDNLGITSIQQWDHPGCGTHLNPLDQYVLKGPISGCRPLQTHFDLCQTTPDWSQVYLINVIYSNLLCASHWGILWVIRAMAHFVVIASSP